MIKPEPKKIPGLRWYMVGMLCLVVPAERFVARHGFQFLDSVDWSFTRQDYRASCESRKYDAVCICDEEAYALCR